MFEDDAASQKDFAIILAAGGAALMVLATGLALFVAVTGSPFVSSGGPLV